MPVICQEEGRCLTASISGELEINGQPYQPCAC